MRCRCVAGLIQSRDQSVDRRVNEGSGSGGDPGSGKLDLGFTVCTLASEVHHPYNTMCNRHLGSCLVRNTSIVIVFCGLL